MELKQGTLLQNGKYRIEKVLGQGGFGITYLATQLGLNRKVAIKEFFMKEYCERAEDISSVSMGTSGSKELVSKFRQKFVKEAQNIAALNHPNIISIYDVFEENQTAYYVMEYLGCGSLSDYVREKGILSEQESKHYIEQIADALSYIHGKKVNHLDVKPGNILLDDKNNAVLIDFGLAKRYDDSGHQTSTTPVGISHGYAPLEQYKQGGVGRFSPTTDIYSLGATLYKLVTGQTPPDAGDVNEEGLPSFPPNISRPTVRAIVESMKGSRKDRPQSIDAFLSILDGNSAVSDEEEEVTIIDNDQAPTPNPSPEPNPKPKKIWKVLMIVMVLIGVIGGYYVVEGIQERKAEQARIEMEQRVQSDKQLYLGYIVEGDKLLSDKQYSLAINKYEIAQTYEDRYRNTDYSGEFDKGSEEKIKGARSAKASYEAEQARLEQARKERERQGIYEVNGVTFKMIKVEGGTFQMGAQSDDPNGTNYDSDAYFWEKPVHSVTLSDYYIGETEVTQELWEAVMGTTVYQQRDKANKDWPMRGVGDDYPMYYVSWGDCQEFIRKLNALTGKNFRLPTEAEWEYAARGGNKSKGYKYSGSDSINNVAWYTSTTHYSGTKQVATKSPNELGIYDMSGNVLEWCQDWYGDYSSSSQTNPKGPSSGADRVLRGGSWDYSVGRCRVSRRTDHGPDCRDRNNGLRLSL